MKLRNKQKMNHLNAQIGTAVYVHAYNIQNANCGLFQNVKIFIQKSRRIRSKN